MTDLISHAIEQGNLMFADTPYASCWMMYHDHLSQWWEKGAQDYIASLGFKDRQVRCVGITNAGTRYEGNLVGNSPELMPLDTHLFNDLKKGVVDHVVATGHLPPGDPDKFSMGTPKELWSAMTRVWEYTPTSHRIVSDIKKWPIAVKKIMEAKGTIVPDMDERHGRRTTMPMVMYHPSAEKAAKARREKFMSQFTE